MGAQLNRRWFNVASAPGTGNVAVGPATSGYATLGAANDGQTFDGVTFIDGTAWEVRNGCVYTHGTTTLTRGTLEDSSTGSAINLSSSTTVMLSVGADTMAMLESLMLAVLPGGRLTTESGVPVSTSDRSAQSTIYYTPFVSDMIVLWDGSRWRPTEFAETSLALSGLTSGRLYDVFAYLSGGSLALELSIWTDDTTRATAVTLQDGRYCKSGDKTRLLLGTIYASGASTTEDTINTRYVANVYNTVSRKVRASRTSGNHTYTTTAIRECNAGSGVTRGRWVTPVTPEQFAASGYCRLASSGLSVGHWSVVANTTTSLGDNGGGVFITMNGFTGAFGDFRCVAAFSIPSRIGFNFMTFTEYGGSGITWYEMNASIGAPL